MLHSFTVHHILVNNCLGSHCVVDLLSEFMNFTDSIVLPHKNLSNSLPYGYHFALHHNRTSFTKRVATFYKVWLFVECTDNPVYNSPDCKLVHMDYFVVGVTIATALFSLIKYFSANWDNSSLFIAPNSESIVVGHWSWMGCLCESDKTEFNQ